MAKRSKLDEYKHTYAGTRLLEKYSLDQEGLWEVLGEDPNCDFGGTHIQPKLCVVQGKLRDVLEEAVNLSGFWTWGAGGDIVLVNVISIDDLKGRADLAERRKQLQQEIAEIDAKLGKILK